MIKNIKKISVIAILLVAVLFPQNNNKTVAIVGNTKITKNEFLSKYELMPHLTENIGQADSIKNEFLYSLIAEKLWALEAENLGYDKLEIIDHLLEPIERLYVKDALFNEVIGKKITITNSDIIKGIARKGIKLEAKIISSTDSAAIYKLSKLIKKGITFDSMLIYQPTPDVSLQPIEIKFGSMADENIEDLLYNLKPGMTSHPVKTKEGWFLFYLVNKISEPGYDKSKQTSEVKRIIKERRVKIVGENFLNAFLSNVKATINETLFKKLLISSKEILSKKNQAADTAKRFLYLTENDITNLIRNYGDSTLNSNFIDFGKNSTTLSQFLNYLMFEGFKVPNAEEPIISGKLKQIIYKYIQQELLYVEGIKKGYKESSSIKEELKTWKESYAAQILRNKFIDSAQVSEDEIRSFYNKKLNRPDSVKQVNIVEILTDKLENVEVILNELKNGKDIKELADRYNQREWTKNKRGEYGFFPITIHGEIGKIAANMQIGQVYGPLKVPEGYSIFKLIDTKDAKLAELKPYEQMRNEIKNDLKYEKLENSMEDYTVKLANKYGVKINKEVLNSIKVTDINMFTYRYMGFGGRLSATPYIAPFYKWMRKSNTIKSNF